MGGEEALSSPLRGAVVEKAGVGEAATEPRGSALEMSLGEAAALVDVEGEVTADAAPCESAGERETREEADPTLRTPDAEGLPDCDIKGERVPLRGGDGDATIDRVGDSVAARLREGLAVFERSADEVALFRGEAEARAPEGELCALPERSTEGGAEADAEPLPPPADVKVAGELPEPHKVADAVPDGAEAVAPQVSEGGGEVVPVAASAPEAVNAAVPDFAPEAVTGAETLLLRVASPENSDWGDALTDAVGGALALGSKECGDDAVAASVALRGCDADSVAVAGADGEVEADATAVAVPQELDEREPVFDAVGVNASDGGVPLDDDEWEGWGVASELPESREGDGLPLPPADAEGPLEDEFPAEPVATSEPDGVAVGGAEAALEGVTADPVGSAVPPPVRVVTPDTLPPAASLGVALGEGISEEGGVALARGETVDERLPPISADGEPLVLISGLYEALVEGKDGVPAGGVPVPPPALLVGIPEPVSNTVPVPLPHPRAEPLGEEEAPALLLPLRLTEGERLILELPETLNDAPTALAKAESDAGAEAEGAEAAGEPV